MGTGESRIRRLWEQVTGVRLDEDQKQKFAARQSAIQALNEFKRDEYLRWTAGMAHRNGVLRLDDWLAAAHEHRGEAPWCHLGCASSYIGRGAQKWRAQYGGACGICGSEIVRGDPIAHGW